MQGVGGEGGDGVVTATLPPLEAGLLEVGLLLYPGVQLAAVYGLSDLFSVANRLARARQAAYGGEAAAVPEIRVSHWRPPPDDGEPVCVSDSHDRLSHPPPHRPLAIVVPPTLGDPPSAALAAPLLPWLAARHAQGATMCSVCAGAFVLAEAGLLAGRRVTTHWNYTAILAQRFPALDIDADKLIIEDGDIITTGGVMAWTDLGLRLVDRLLGGAVMLETARFLLIDPAGREQRHYSRFSPRLRHGDPAVLKVQHRLQVEGARDVSVAAMAAQAGLGERTFLRRFHKATGMTPTEYCQHVRVGRARDMLETTTLPIDRIAWDVGYGDPGAFRKVFCRIVGLSPGDYRRRFAVGASFQGEAPFR